MAFEPGYVVEAIDTSKVAAEAIPTGVKTAQIGLDNGLVGA